MSKRAYCPNCQRPISTCICHLAVAINNKVNVLILQHPSEVKQSKGTATLLTQSLQASTVMVGECFDQDEVLNHYLKQFQHVALLYPSDDALPVKPSFFQQMASDAITSDLVSVNSAVGNHDFSNCCIVLLDGTWKKAYRMFMVNNWLQQLPKLTLAPGHQGNYQIRKTQKQGALSTLEACCYALMALEDDKASYQPLLDAFEAFNQMQLAFIKSAKK